MSDSKLSRDIMYMNKHEHVKDEEKKKKKHIHYVKCE